MQEPKDQYPAEPSTISVVIPTFNRARSLHAAIMSVLNQSIPVLEVIVVDDCSSDDTSTVLKRIDDVRLRIVRTERQSGAAAARNLGVRQASGNWIAFQDSDDYWFAYKLERQMERARQLPEAVLCYCKLIQYYAGSVSLVPNKNVANIEGYVHEELLLTNFISTQTMLLKRSCFESAGGFNESLPSLEDWEFALRLAKWGKFCLVEEPLVIAFDTPGNLTSDAKKGNEARLKILDIHHADYVKRPALLAHHFHVIGKSYLDIRNLNQARRFFWKAIQNQPQRLNSLYWLFNTFCRYAYKLLLLQRPD